MKDLPLSPIATREAVHVLLLRELAALGGGRAVTLKGGVNLRLFFGSLRYSQDMDLDGEPAMSEPIRDAIHTMFTDRRFARTLGGLGLRGLDPGQGPNKDTDTVFRHKFHIVGPGDIRYPTKVEISFRPRREDDETRVEAPSNEIVGPYLGGSPPFELRHYGRAAAQRQKLAALAGRRVVQARDVFDLHALGLDATDDSLVNHLAVHVDADTLRTALGRVFEVSPAEFQGQVVEFLAEDARERYGSPDSWDRLRIAVAEGIEAALRRRGEDR